MKFSLRKKTILMITGIALIISLVSIFSSRKGVTDIVRLQYSSKAEDLADTAAGLIDIDDVRSVRDATLAVYDQVDQQSRISNEEWGTPALSEYNKRFSAIESMPEYIRLHEWLRIIQDKNHIDCLYLVYPQVEDQAFIYLVDPDRDNPCCPGSFDYFTKINREAMKTPEHGMITEISNSAEYGALLTAGKPVLDRDGQVVAIVCVDFSIQEILRFRDYYNMVMGLIMIVLVVIISVIAGVIVDRSIVRPINDLSEASLEYCDDDAGKQHDCFSRLDIHTGDEIESLAHSMVRMEKDINDQLSQLVKRRNELIAARIKEMKMDLIANVDALTRVRNKRAYDQAAQRLNLEIQTGSARFGIAMADLNNLKMLNDTYGHDKGDIGIKNLCGIACSVFKHSPVYRIGGDEFVIVLEGEDLAHIDELIELLNERIMQKQSDDSLQPWEKTSAAVGCAFYIPGQDKCVEDVFKRADALMYEHKKKLKAGRVREIRRTEDKVSQDDGSGISY